MAVWTSSTMLLLILSMQLVPADSVPATIEGVTVVPAVAVGQPVLMITWSVRNGDTITEYEIENRLTGTAATGLVATATETTYTILSLQPGTMYDIRVRAVATEGEGVWSDWISGTTFNVPPAPDEVTVQASTTAGHFLVTWTEPTVNDGSTITGYSLQYRRTDASSSSYATVQITGGDTTSRVVMSLDLGTGYSVRIASVDDRLGLGGYSQENTGYTYGYSPALPVSASPLAQRGEIQVSWTTPTPPTGSSITSYSIQYRVRGSSGAYTTINGIVSTATSHTISGLTLGAEFEVRATGQTEIGATSGTYGQAAFVTVYANSPAPSTPSVLPRTTAGQLLATWTKPTVNDGSTITGYSLQYKRISDSSYSPDNTVQISGGNTAPRVLMGLDLSTGYSVRIASVNQLGTGPYSSEHSATTYGYPPALSVSASALAQRGQIRVSWTTPTPPTGSSIISYSIQYRVRGSSGDYTTINGILSTATSHTISGLTLGAEYEVRATAQTEIGATSSTYRQTLVTTYNVPPEVENLTITISKIEEKQGTKSLTTTWTPPQSDQPITSYDISYRVIQPTVVWMGEFSPPSTQHMHSYEVAKGQDYEVRVRAVSVIGGGEYDTQRTIVPDEPTTTSSQYYETSITLAWTKSGADDFIIYYKKAQTDDTEYLSMDSSEPIATITGLESNTQYKMIIGGRNRFGSTNSSTIDTYTLAETPGSTRAWALSPSSIQVTWTPSLNTEPQPGRLAVDYRVSYAGISPYTTENRTTGTSTANLTITGLHPYIKYTVSVQAHNSAGHSAASSTTVWTYSDKPTIQPGETRYQTMSRWCSLTWKRPPPTGRNGIITNYVLQIEYPDGAIRNKTVGLSNPTFTHPEETTYNLTNLTPYTTYKWRVAATTVNGTGPFSTSHIAFRTLEDVPGPISNLSFTASSNTTAKVSWELPAAPNGVVTQYTVECKEVTMGSNMTVKNITSLTMTTTTTLNDLRAYIPYNVTVTVHTSVGAGEPTSIILFTVEGVPKKAVSDFKPRYGSDGTTAVILWTKLTLEEARGIPLYIIRYRSKDGSSTGTVNTTNSSVTITGLSPDKEYEFSIQVSTGNGLNTGMAVTVSVPRSSLDAPVIAGAVAGGVLVVVFLLVLVLICTCAMKRRRKRSYKAARALFKVEKNEGYLELDLKNKKGKKWGKKEAREFTNDEVRIVPTEHFVAVTDHLHSNSNEGFEDEYQTIANDPDASVEVSRENHLRNRYINIFTYDEFRVVLSQPNSDDTDYINGSYIEGYHRDKEYIAVQGPTPSTVSDFWQMVWDHKSTMIVMVTKVEESGKKKCEQYWNLELNDPLEVGNGFVVTTTVCRGYPDYEISDIILTNAQDPAAAPVHLKHFHYTAWPDHGVPSYPSSLVRFALQVRQEFVGSEAAPMVVHCSAGVGRTGTFITVDAMLEALKDGQKELNIYDFVTKMRKRRTFMVQTQSQYACIHDAICDHLTCGDTSIVAHSLRKVISDLEEIDRKTDNPQYFAKFAFLESLCKTPGPVDEALAKKAVISKKNRYKDRFPYADTYVHVADRGMANNGDYINASFLNSYSLSKAYIACQAPLENTRSEVWETIWQLRISTVVLLCDFEEEGQSTCCRFWPDDKQKSLEYSFLKVNLVGNEPRNFADVTTLEISEKKQTSGRSLTVTLYHSASWPASGGPPVDCVLGLMGQVKSDQEKGCRTTMVMCSDGMGRSGVFVCAMAEVERVKMEGHIDIFQTVKCMRSRRPKMVSTPEQYKLCFDILQSYLDSFDSYANFKAV